jgi:hypothetical protein
MKTKTKILLLAMGLILPYTAFVLYSVLTHPEHPFPGWFFYVGPCYFFGSILVFVLARKKIVAIALPPAPTEKIAQGVKSARALRFLGYIWLIGPVMRVLGGGLKEPTWIEAVAFCWVGFLSWACFYQARKIESRVRQEMAAGPILGA